MCHNGNNGRAAWALFGKHPRLGIDAYRKTFDLHSKQHLRNPGPRFNIKMPSYQYRKSNCGDKTVVRSFYLHNGISFIGKTTSLYWIKAQVIIPWILHLRTCQSPSHNFVAKFTRFLIHPSTQLPSQTFSNPRWNYMIFLFFILGIKCDSILFILR